MDPSVYDAADSFTATGMPILYRKSSTLALQIIAAADISQEDNLGSGRGRSNCKKSPS